MIACTGWQNQRPDDGLADEGRKSMTKVAQA
jgi:hypothetical protein